MSPATLETTDCALSLNLLVGVPYLAAKSYASAWERGNIMTQTDLILGNYKGIEEGYDNRILA